MRIHHRLTVFAVLIPALTGAALTSAHAAPAKRARALTPGLQSAALGTAAAGPAVSWVLTTGDRRQLLSAQTPTSFGPDLSSYYSWSRIDINDAVRYQTVQGVGAAMTESSAVLLGGLPAAQKTQVLNRLFNRATGAGLSVIRTPLGASDFARSDYTFDDMPWGKTDPSLARFSISRDKAQLLPLVAAARGINAGLTVLATPWTAPAWMKTNVNTHNGQLAPAFEDAYARYLVKAITAYRAAGAPVSTVAVTNEPESPRGYSPSMTMTATQQAEFVGTHLRPALNAAGLSGVS
ncbi:MAG: glycoside hydrolase family 30, partial [Frankiales bacterium]|nr:glycoside hydrolase family 30 [Frankiales bacterium]